jgi:hypothetical protein
MHRPRFDTDDEQILLLLMTKYWRYYGDDQLNRKFGEVAQEIAAELPNDRLPEGVHHMVMAIHA